MFGRFVNIQVCSTCNGEGSVITEKCRYCGGEGRVKTESIEKVKIPAGVSSGNYISLRNKGNAGIRGGASGDLIVFIEEEEHKHFIREGDDIHYNLMISITEAVLGAEVEIPVLGGTVIMKIEPGTQPGKILRLREKGIRHLNTGGRGDQLVHINVFIPTKLNSEEKELFSQLSHSHNLKPTGRNKDDKRKGFFSRIKDNMK
jgi:molecular chaperone DnaJ